MLKSVALGGRRKFSSSSLRRSFGTRRCGCSVLAGLLKQRTLPLQLLLLCLQQLLLLAPLLADAPHAFFSLAPLKRRAHFGSSCLSASSGSL